MAVLDIPGILAIIAAGALQGITELLPISSSGHLLLFAETTSITLSIYGIAILHLGTLGALLVVMWKSLPEAIKYPTNINILIAIIPAGIIGFLFASRIEAYLGTPVIIIISLIFWGVGLIVADLRARSISPDVTRIEQITPQQALIIGLSQVVAFIPGTSRAGITTIAGIFSGLSRKTALKFSFLMGIPILALSGFYSLGKLTLQENSWVDPIVLTIAFITSFLVGIIAARIFLNFVEKNILTICGIYRIVLGILITLVLVLF